MKRLTLITFIMLLIGSSSNISANNSTIDTKESAVDITKEIHKKFNDIQSIRCEGSFFDIRTEGISGNETTVDAYIDGKFRGFLKTDMDIDVILDNDDGRLNISIDMPNGINTSIIERCEIIIRTPSSTNLDIKCSSGDIQAYNMEPQKIYLTASSGDIYLSKVKCNSPIDLRASSGSVSAKHITCPILTINTSSGDIIVEDANTNVAARCSSGDMQVEGVKGECELKTTSGELRSRNVSGGVLAESSSGSQRHINIQNYAKTSSSSGDIGMYNINGICKARASSGEIEVNDSRGEFSLSTNSGDIEGNNIFLTRNSHIKSTSGEISCSLANKTDEVGFDLRSVSGDLRAGRYSSEDELVIKNGNILVTGRSTSGDQTYHFK